MLARPRGAPHLVRQTTTQTLTSPEDEVAPAHVALLRISEAPQSMEEESAPDSDVATSATHFGRLVGTAPEMCELFAALRRIAPTELALLAQGESGTGKEEVARAVHSHSSRKHGPFVVLDAATVPSTLAESVLFGHERGAFTGAEARHVGIFERAHGGTLFLDEIGELPLDLQPKLLRVLETRTITRVGGTQPVSVDFRLISATHRDLAALVEARLFREDLFFRLSQVGVILPPLRARIGDIRLLAECFLADASTNERPVRITDDAVAVLESKRWSGNVRELRNVIARAAALCEDGVVDPRDLAIESREAAADPEIFDLDGTFSDAKARTVERFERAYLAALVRRCGGNLSRASRQADIARNHLRALLKKRDLYDR